MKLAAKQAEAPSEDSDWLAAQVGVDQAALGRLRFRLADDASTAGLLDVAYRVLDSPVGCLLVATTRQGLVRVAFDSEDHERVLEGLAQRVSPRILRAPHRLDEVSRQLDGSFRGERRQFELTLDLRLAHGFRREVLDHLRRLEYGRTQSYGDVARLVQRPGAVRAVGSACATNPLPIVVPCHRVLRSDGSLGGYLGGLEVKRRLLALESEVLQRPG
jgi:methylated-DNA-[protein]-cysteine S-methyltransferase